jgi:restriction system protein
MGKTVEKKIYEKLSRHLPTNFTYLNRSAINFSQAQNKQHFRIVFIVHGFILIKQWRSKRPIVLTSSLRIEDENCFKKYPKRIDVSILDQFPEFVAFRSKHVDEETHSGSDETIPPQSIGSATPEEAIQAAEEEISQNLRGQLLERIFELSPTFFEQLVLDLIVAMKYGGAKVALAERTGGSGDEGFDGIINEDPLGLDKIYLQAKRYAPRVIRIGRPMIQQFAGALAGKGASKGVFLTTSSFATPAIAFSKQVPQRIILIDGEELAKLMIQYDVGVRIERTVEIKRIDLDYFEESEE